MRNIRLTDGSTYPVDRCGAANDILYLNVPGGDFPGLVAIFAQPALTERIEHWFDGTEVDHIVYEGYTRLSSASLSFTGVSLVLQKGVT